MVAKQMTLYLKEPLLTGRLITLYNALTRGLKKHRDTQFFDIRERAAAKYQHSKVIDRLTNEKVKFPFLVLEDL